MYETHPQNYRYHIPQIPRKDALYWLNELLNYTKLIQPRNQYTNSLERFVLMIYATDIRLLLKS